MAVYLSALLILTGLTGICCLTTVTEVSVKAGDSVTIPCLYDRQYIKHVKFLCEGYYWNHCSYVVKTNQPDRSGRFSISDNKTQRIFTVTVKQVANTTTDYWCAVEINRGSDIRHYFHLSVTSMPSLYVDHQEVTGVIGESITINCRYSNTGTMGWCRLGKNCVTRSSGSIDGTKVTINARSWKVFAVTMSKLKAESSGWYWCAIGNYQMPVHVIVKERPTTSTPPHTTHNELITNGQNVCVKERPTTSTNSYSTDVATITTVANGQNSAFIHIGLKSLIIRLSVLVVIVLVGLTVWFVLKHKQTKAESSSRTVTQEDATYSEVEFIRENSPQRSNAGRDVEVM